MKSRGCFFFSLYTHFNCSAELQNSPSHGIFLRLRRTGRRTYVGGAAVSEIHHWHVVNASGCGQQGRPNFSPTLTSPMPCHRFFSAAQAMTETQIMSLTPPLTFSILPAMTCAARSTQLRLLVAVPSSLQSAQPEAAHHPLRHTPTKNNSRQDESQYVT